MTGKGYALGAQVRTTSADPAQAHVGEGKKLELPVIRPKLARALAWPGLLAFCPSKSPSGRC